MVVDIVASSAMMVCLAMMVAASWSIVVMGGRIVVGSGIRVCGRRPECTVLRMGCYSF